MDLFRIFQNYLFVKLFLADLGGLSDGARVHVEQQLPGEGEGGVGKFGKMETLAETEMLCPLVGHSGYNCP